MQFPRFGKNNSTFRDGKFILYLCGKTISDKETTNVCLMTSYLPTQRTG